MLRCDIVLAITLGKVNAPLVRCRGGRPVTRASGGTSTDIADGGQHSGGGGADPWQRHEELEVRARFT